MNLNKYLPSIAVVLFFCVICLLMIIMKPTSLPLTQVSGVAAQAMQTNQYGFSSVSIVMADGQSMKLTCPPAQGQPSYRPAAGESVTATGTPSDYKGAAQLTTQSQSSIQPSAVKHQVASVPLSELAAQTGKTVSVQGTITAVRDYITKKGKPMQFFTVTDSAGQAAEGVNFESDKLTVSDQPINLLAKVEDYQGSVSLVFQAVQ